MGNQGEISWGGRGMESYSVGEKRIHPKYTLRRVLKDKRHGNCWRINPEAKVIMNRIMTCQNLSEACFLAIDLMINYDCIQVSVPIKYDENTGKPIEYKWIQGSEFANPVFDRICEYTKGISEEYICFPNKLYKVIEKNPVIIEYKSQSYSFTPTDDGIFVTMVENSSNPE